MKIKTSLASEKSYGGNRILRSLYLTIDLSVYNTQSDVLFVPPVNTRQHPTIPERSTRKQITKLDIHKESDHNEFHKYDKNDKVLKLLFIGAVDEAYIIPLRGGNRLLKHGNYNNDHAHINRIRKNHPGGLE